MAKLRNMVKYVESNPTNKKNYELVLKDHMNLLTNEFKRYLNVTIVIAAHNLVRYFLRLKEAICVHYERYDATLFLTQNEWNNSFEIEAVPHDTSRLTAFYQNEKKLIILADLLREKTS